MSSLGLFMFFRFLQRFRKPTQDAWGAAVYQYNERLIIHACNRTYNNYGWNSEPVTTLPVDADQELIGRTIRGTMLSSRWDAKTPDPLEVGNPILEAADVESWKVLERNALLINFALKDGTVTITPYRAARRSEGRGWVGMDLRRELPEDCSDLQLAEAAFWALERCIGWIPKS